jgi:hypothetical protein
MAKANSRKHAGHKKAHAHHAAKTHAHRPSAAKRVAPEAAASAPNKTEQDSVGDEFTIQAASRVVVYDLDEEAGVYGPDRGESTS